MKKIVYKYIGAVLVVCLIMISILKVVDMHRDKIKVRDGLYYLYSSVDSKDMVWDIPYGIEHPEMNLHLWTFNYGASQQFYLQNIGDDKCSILFGNNNLCVGVAEDGVNVEIQEYVGSEQQHWYLKRVNNTQQFTIKNSFNGLYIEAVESEEEQYYDIIVSQLDEKDKEYYFVLQKIY